MQPRSQDLQTVPLVSSHSACSTGKMLCAVQYASVSSTHEASDTAMEGRVLTSVQAETSKQYYARQLMQPEWLTDIPADLSANWCAVCFSLLCIQLAFLGLHMHFPMQ